MYYALVQYPDIPKEQVDSFRQKYDPYFPGIGSHITLMFPVPVEEVPENAMTEHLSSVLSHWKSFDIHLAGFEKAVDHWLFLTVKEGNNEVVRLHDELYTGPLQKYLRPDLPFIPHIALGFFGKEGSGYNLENPTVVEFDEEKYKEALEEAEKLGLNYRTKVDKVNLIKIENNLQTIVDNREIKLV